MLTFFFIFFWWTRSFIKRENKPHRQTSLTLNNRNKRREADTKSSHQWLNSWKVIIDNYAWKEGNIVEIGNISNEKSEHWTYKMGDKYPCRQTSSIKTVCNNSTCSMQYAYIIVRMGLGLFSHSKGHAFSNSCCSLRHKSNSFV